MGKHGWRVAAILVLALLAVGLLQQRRLTQERRRREQAELDAGLAASRVLSARFEATGELRAARLSGQVVSRGDCTSAYLFGSQQKTVAPYSINYMVDLSRVDRASFRWDARDRIMFVEVPGVTVEPPAIDMSRARSAQSGLFISRKCGLAMQQQVSSRLSAAAQERGRRAAYLVRAGASARTEVTALIRTTLAAAGLNGVQVRVRLATDPRPADDRAWDRSRSIEEVLADPTLSR
ncbi:hypothetical protein [uncultured Sphingomonas sp.]|uniref:hypothetical protein n=1 Tax=uncultured Sphingomonas sp. TaxID=158754 RepID=UPI0035C9DF0F